MSPQELLKPLGRGMCNSLKEAIIAIFTLTTCLVQISYAAELKLLHDDVNQPVLLTHADGSFIFIVEKTGKIFAYKGTQKHLFLDVSSLITTRGSEQGLLSIAFHPNYSENGYLFLFYTAKNGDNTLARLTIDQPAGKQTDLKSLEVLISQEDPASNHNGGLLAFGHDGYLYLGIGDG